ncbi:hypothetical protein E2C01_064718 [Portunus trituberculatus]|uniref:Uncharacterized protein n=1 Tax=Portunus trituberculatus TaxID=210409 RepID=A0A5B7HL44_PORTR|nr:hypothetical protein [Portunus trituberculatus]
MTTAKWPSFDVLVKEGSLPCSILARRGHKAAPKLLWRNTSGGKVYEWACKAARLSWFGSSHLRCPSDSRRVPGRRKLIGNAGPVFLSPDCKASDKSV